MPLQFRFRVFRWRGFGRAYGSISFWNDGCQKWKTILNACPWNVTEVQRLYFPCWTLKFLSTLIPFCTRTRVKTSSANVINNACSLRSICECLWVYFGPRFLDYAISAASIIGICITDLWSFLCVQNRHSQWAETHIQQAEMPKLNVDCPPREISNAYGNQIRIRCMVNCLNAGTLKNRMQIWSVLSGSSNESIHKKI